MNKKLIISALIAFILACLGVTYWLLRGSDARNPGVTDFVVDKDVQIQDRINGSNILGPRFGSSNTNAIEPQNNDNILAFNEKDLRQVAGFFDDVFVGKVVDNLQTEVVQGLVLTNYDVVVLDALKGGVSGRIKITQQGGVIDGTWTLYVPTKQRDDIQRMGDKTHGSNLVTGQVYLFSTIQNDKLATNLLGPTAVSYVPLKIEGSKVDAQIKLEAAETPEVKAMKTAIENQIDTRNR